MKGDDKVHTFDEKSIWISSELTFIPSCECAFASRLEFNVPMAAITETNRSVGIAKSFTGSLVVSGRLNLMLVTIFFRSAPTKVHENNTIFQWKTIGSKIYSVSQKYSPTVTSFRPPIRSSGQTPCLPSHCDRCDKK